MTTLARVCVSLVFCVACADTAGPLCDGSTDIRLAAYSGGGGPLPDASGFINPSGHASLLVDGQCHYYVESGYSGGIASGTLSSSEVEQLTRDVHWDELASWTYVFKDDQSCPDAGYSAIAGAQGFGGCSCGCDPGAPAGLEDALNKTFAWSERLAAEGQPLTGPVSGLALDTTEQTNVLVNVKGAAIRFREWPLDREMSAVPDLIHQRNDAAVLMGTATYASFSDSAEYEKLRELRASFVADEGSELSREAGIPILDASRNFDLFIRDELPEAVEKSWEMRRVTLPL